ncbi:Dyp-type peroxidase [Actomonas aquatica]|uniref:Dyp-type peroxidase n=1 Tax=Actomonas aquatica TaxID=2866162 RepID=A0ABZ1C482_9BACT|nr:Dyp-type peroxidase domain-containing protein [Opitutus sp. WL0086]WRQ86167.1 Dyp-type peroxidase [Opitutus sp. WL0086]
MPNDFLERDRFTATEESKLLHDLQCNILAPHRRVHSAHLLIGLPSDGAQARRYVGEWSDRVTRASEVAEDQAKRTRTLKRWGWWNVAWTGRWRIRVGKAVGWDRLAESEPRPALKRGLVRSFMVSHGALRADRLGRSEEIPLVETEFRALTGAGETEPMSWSAGAWERPFRGNQIEAQILLASDDLDELKEAVAAEQTRLETGDMDGRVLQTLWGYVARDRERRPVEHFGFVDGVSNPEVLESEYRWATRRHGVYRPRFPLKSFLFELNGSPGRYASFQVLQKIEQHVGRFRQLSQLEQEAMVGRKADGTPLEAMGPGGINDFVYDFEASKPRCPFHAHIRKSNPRLTKLRSEMAVLFPRRGMLYGEREADVTTGEFRDEPDSGVGLLFMGYMGGIHRQFGRMVKTWMANSRFGGGVHTQNVGEDLIGPAREPDPAKDYTTVLGGAYFMVPPLAWLEEFKPTAAAGSDQ